MGSIQRLGTALPAAAARFCVVLAAALVLVFAPAPVAAQGTPASAQAQTILLEPLTLTKGQDMDFGSIATDGTAASVVMTPTATGATCESVGAIVHTGSCAPGEFGGYGEVAREIRIKFPAGGSIVVSGPGADMEIKDLQTDATGLLYLGNGRGFVRYLVVEPEGLFTFRLGGTLNVNAGQAPGAYSGTYEIRLDYR